VNLYQVNFAHSDLAKSVFTETLAIPLTVKFSQMESSSLRAILMVRFACGGLQMGKIY
jgi:hypothetical protein